MPGLIAVAPMHLANGHQAIGMAAGAGDEARRRIAIEIRLQIAVDAGKLAVEMLGVHALHSLPAADALVEGPAPRREERGEAAQVATQCTCAIAK